MASRSCCRVAPSGLIASLLYSSYTVVGGAATAARDDVLRGTRSHGGVEAVIIEDNLPEPEPARETAEASRGLGGVRWYLGAAELVERTVKPIAASLFRHHPEKCEHMWQKEPNFTKYERQCPYGTAGWGDVTFPDYKKAKDLKAPLTDQTLLRESEGFKNLCIGYSYVFYLVGGVSFWNLLKRCGTQELHYFLFLIVVLGVQEVLVKPFVQMPRPEMSCLNSCGMPSSHAALSIGTLTLYMINSALRSTSRFQSSCVMVPGYFRMLIEEEEKERQKRQKQNSSSSRCPRPFSQIIECIIRIRPTSALGLNHSRFDEPSPTELVIELVLWMIFILPVPLSRVQLADHTEQQVYMGMVVGIIVAVLWSYFTWTLQQRHNATHIGKRLGPCDMFHHNMALPCGRAMRQAILADASCDSDVILDMLEWYEKETLYRLYKLEEVGALGRGEDDYLMLRWCLIHELQLHYDKKRAPTEGRRFGSNQSNQGGQSTANRTWEMEHKDKRYHSIFDPDFEKRTRMHDLRNRLRKHAEDGDRDYPQPVLAWSLLEERRRSRRLTSARSGPLRAVREAHLEMTSGPS